MAVFFIVLLGLSVVYFLYESIILPSIRLSIRLSLFEIRDDLRRLLAEHPEEIGGNPYKYMQESINTTVAFLYLIDLQLLWDTHILFHDDYGLLHRIKKRDKVVKSCQSYELQRIRTRALKLVSYVIVANSAGFLFVAMPVLIVAAGVTILLGRVETVVYVLKQAIKDLIYIPEKELPKFQRLYAPVPSQSWI